MVSLAAIGLLWWPFRHGFIALLSAAAERVLRLVDDPPLVTSLQPQEGAILVHSYITGLERAIASWSGENLHFYVVVTLALVVAVPFRTWEGRIRLAAVSAAVIFLVSLALCAVQLKEVVEVEAGRRLGITLHASGEMAFLEAADRFLIMVGMLLFPAFLFLISYLSFWMESWKPETRRGREKPPRRRPPSSRWRAWAPTAALGLAGFVAVWAFLAATRQETDPWKYRAGWEKVLRLNPGYAPARFHVGQFEEKAGHLEEAIEMYKHALEADPDLLEAHFTLGNAYYQQGLYHLAAQRFKKSTLLEPDFALGHRNLGICLLELGFECDALRHLDRSMRLDVRLFNDPQLRNETDRLRSACPEPPS